MCQHKPNHRHKFSRRAGLLLFNWSQRFFSRNSGLRGEKITARLVILFLFVRLSPHHQGFRSSRTENFWILSSHSRSVWHTEDGGSGKILPRYCLSFKLCNGLSV